MHKITILGMSDFLNNIDVKKKKIILRTRICDAKDWFEKSGVDYSTLDNIYDAAADFDVLDKMLADEVIKQALTNEILYIVDGSAIALDGSVHEIFVNYDNVEIIPGMPVEYDLLSKCKNANASCGYAVIPAGCLESGMFSPRLPLIISAIDNEYLLSDIKIMLADEFGDKHIVIIGDKSCYKKMPVYKLDRYKNCDHNTIIYVPVRCDDARYDLFELEGLFSKLRSPEGCPWDKEQTHQSLRRNMLEECAEVIEAIDDGDMDKLCDELGDVLLQVIFHSQLAGERGDFDMRDVCDNLARKLIKRHPHVFADMQADNPDEVKKIWDAVKSRDLVDKTFTSKLKDVPKTMTALMRAQKVLSRAGKADFIIEEKDSRKNIKGIIEIAADNLMQLEKVIYTDDTECEYLIGEILFNIANASRLLKIESELTLIEAINRYIEKFSNIESAINQEI